MGGQPPLHFSPGAPPPAFTSSHLLCFRQSSLPENKYDVVETLAVVALGEGGAVAASVVLPCEALPMAVADAAGAVAAHTAAGASEEAAALVEDEERPVSKYADDLPMLDNGVISAALSLLREGPTPRHCARHSSPRAARQLAALAREQEQKRSACRRRTRYGRSPMLRSALAAPPPDHPPPRCPSCAALCGGSSDFVAAGATCACACCGGRAR